MRIVNFWKTLFSSIYWCFIPLYCRNCHLVHKCRSSFFKGRKCYNGCILHKESRRKYYDALRKESIDNLINNYEEHQINKGYINYDRP